MGYLPYLLFVLTIGLLEITHTSEVIPDLNLFVLLIPLVYLAQTNGRKIPWLAVITTAIYSYFEYKAGTSISETIQLVIVSVFIISIILHLREREQFVDSIDVIVVRLAVSLEAVRKLRNFEVYHYLPREFKEYVDIIEDAVGNLLTKKSWLDLEAEVKRMKASREVQDD